MLTRSLSERLSQHRDVISQIAVLDETVRPYSLHQSIFADQLSAAFDEGQQYLKTLGGEGHRRAVTQQQAPGCIDSEGTELAAQLW
jgi:hypothetical protein